MKKCIPFIASILVLLLSSSFAPGPARSQLNVRLVFIGNSITQGVLLKDAKTQSPPFWTFSKLREKKNLSGLRFANCGVSGATTLDYLPNTGEYYKAVIDSGNKFMSEANSLLIFSVMA